MKADTLQAPRRWYTLLPLIAVLVAACYTVPETGRSSLNFVPESQVVSLAADQFTAMKQQLPVSRNSQYNATLQRVGERIRSSVGYAVFDGEWEFVVFEDPALNAFAMPGGKVGVYTGMMEFVKSEDELAIIVGHEIAHVAARHSSERLSQQLGVGAIAAAVGVAVSDQDDTTQALVLGALGAGATLGVLLPFSRKHETEADEIGLLYAARAGYDPRVAVDFWSRMSQQGSGDRPPEFLSTHPGPENRVQNLQELMPQALDEYYRATGRRLQ